MPAHWPIAIFSNPWPLSRISGIKPHSCGLPCITWYLGQFFTVSLLPYHFYLMWDLSTKCFAHCQSAKRDRVVWSEIQDSCLLRPLVPINSLLCQALRLISPFDCPTSARSFIFYTLLLQKASKAPVPWSFLLTISALIKKTPKCRGFRINHAGEMKEVCKLGWQCDMNVRGWCLEDMKSAQLKCHPCTISEDRNMIKAEYR